MVGYYRQYIPSFAITARPLHRLTRKGEKRMWGKKEQTAFEELQKHLSSAPVLSYPDSSPPYALDIVVSVCGVGLVQSHSQDGTKKVIAFFNNTLAPAERNHCPTRRELLVVVIPVKHFRLYFYKGLFLLCTDHISLQ